MAVAVGGRRWHSVQWMKIAQESHASGARSARWGWDSNGGLIVGPRGCVENGLLVVVLEVGECMVMEGVRVAVGGGGCVSGC